ncbi:MAG: iron ABC transporter permease [Gammaproteobacteria bacterium]|nr:iron ABC transporter permease [Gammaproteobacteria bacterium]
MENYQSQIIQRRILLLALLGLTPLALLFAISTGSVSIPFSEVWAALFSEQGSINQTLVMELRLPRALSALVTGGMLALAGVLMQVLLRNPLADPYILGVSGGAATATLTAMLLGLSSAWITGSAVAGALLSILLVFGLAHGQGSWTSTRLLLTGVVIATGWGAIISFILATAPERNLHGMLFWLMGDLSHSESSNAGLVILLLGLFASMTIARHLNVMTRGELQAGALGVNTKKIKLQIYLVASLLTAGAVTIAGSVGFIGLIVPHMLRLVIGNDHRSLIPASILAGGILLLVADTIARTIIAPQQLPVGVITAMIGVPVFLYLIHRNRQS